MSTIEEVGIASLHSVLVNDDAAKAAHAELKRRDQVLADAASALPRGSKLTTVYQSLKDAVGGQVEGRETRALTVERLLRSRKISNDLADALASNMAAHGEDQTSDTIAKSAVAAFILAVDADLVPGFAESIADGLIEVLVRRSREAA